MGLLLTATLLPLDLAAASASPPPTQRPTLAALTTALRQAASQRTAPPASTDLPSLTNLNQVWSSPNGTRTGLSHPECSDSGASLPLAAATDCVYGDLSATRTLFAYGDSNAQMWIPALDEVGLDLHWRVVAVSQASCQPWATPWLAPSLTLFRGITVANCDSWRNDVFSVLKVVKPTYVIPIGVGPRDHETAYPTMAGLEQSITALVGQLRKFGTKPLFLQPMPRYDASLPITISPIACLTVHPSNVLPCALTPAMETKLMAAVAYKAVAKSAKVPEVSTQNLFCTAHCPLFVQSGKTTYLVYKDVDHMTFQYAQFISRAFEEDLKANLQG